jgi:PAS domain S-box-containing protein
MKTTPTETVTSVLSRKDAESDALFLSIGEGAIATDEHGRISRVNRAALEILGYTEADLMGRFYQEAIVAEDEEGQVIPAPDRPIAQAIATQEPVATRLTYRKGDGTRVTVYLTVSVIMLDGGSLGAIQVFRDITHEVELERAKDEFISLASHQLRTPASAVKQYAGMLLQGYVGELADKQRSMIESIYESNERQIAIVNDLLRVAQVDAGKVHPKIVPTDLANLIKGVMSDLDTRFKAKNQKVTYLRPAKDLVVEVDPQLLRMVIENIIDNASKYTPADRNITVDLYKIKDHISIAIRDEGVGIDEKDIPQIFQKFSRVPNPLSETVGGTGLGLYWAKRIVDLHNGKIQVSSKPGRGTTFIIQIPLVPTVSLL